MWYVQHKDQNLSMFLRYGLAFGTRVLKTRVPERAFWVDPLSKNPKLMYFLGLDTETFFPPNKKWFWELLATRKLIFLTPDPFLAEAKKVLASPGLWGKLGFLPGSFFSLKEKRFKPFTNFSVVLLTEVQEDFEKLLKSSMWHSRSFLQGGKKGLGGFWSQKNTINPPCVRNARSGTRVLRSALWSCQDQNHRNNYCFHM